MAQPREIRAEFDRHSIVIYQAYDDAIADAALKNGRFSPPFSLTRMTWIKPSFLWLMARSNWGKKPGQQRILKVRVSRAGWDRALALGVLTSYDKVAHNSPGDWARNETAHDEDGVHHPAKRAHALSSAISMRVVFIASLVHSGSTVLDLLLGRHPRLVGLGELSGFLDPVHGHLQRLTDIVCSCGEPLVTCSFWRPVTQELLRNPDAGREENYAALARVFRRELGDEAILVDSSKSLAGLAVWTRQADVEPRAIHLIRDVRAWTVSMGELQRRLGEARLGDLLRKHGPRGARNWLAQTVPNRFRQWHRVNRGMERGLDQLGVPAFRLGYEELCLQPERALGAVAQFLELPAFPAGDELEHSGSHVVLGNRMHRQQEKRRRLIYDDRWMHRRSWLLAALLCRKVMAYNARRVYRNLPDDLWSR